MKNFLITTILVILFVETSKAQIEEYRIGITVGPSVSYVRTATESASTNIDRESSELKFLLGAFVDIQFKENYFFHTGVNFATRSTKINVTDPVFFSGNRIAAEYDHEYLQIPLLLKLYTNEVTLDTKVFFNLGLVPEVRLNTSSNNVAAVTEFQHLDLTGNFGGGLERAIGIQTSLFAAINYNIGFLNQVKEQSPALSDEIVIKNNLIALEFGIKF